MRARIEPYRRRGQVEADELSGAEVLHHHPDRAAPAAADDQHSTASDRIVVDDLEHEADCVLVEHTLREIDRGVRLASNRDVTEIAEERVASKWTGIELAADFVVERP